MTRTGFLPQMRSLRKHLASHRLNDMLLSPGCTGRQPRLTDLTGDGDPWRHRYEQLKSQSPATPSQLSGSGPVTSPSVAFRSGHGGRGAARRTIHVARCHLAIRAGSSRVHAAWNALRLAGGRRPFGTSNRSTGRNLGVRQSGQDRNKSYETKYCGNTHCRCSLIAGESITLPIPRTDLRSDPVDIMVRECRGM